MNSTSAAVTRDTDAIHPDIWKITCVAVIGAFMCHLDATIANVSLSSLAKELHSNLTVIQWVTSGYLLALALVLPINGWLIDRIGGRALYFLALAGFTITSALCGLAWSTESLIAFRVLQGVSGGLLAPMAQITMARAAGKHMTSVLSVAALPVVSAPLLGPIIAGVILQYASWRWLFLINLPVGALAILLTFLFLPDDREENKPRILDVKGLCLLSPGLVLFLYGAEHLREIGGLVSLASAVLLLTAFLRSSKEKGDEALIDLRLFDIKAFRAAVVTQFLANGVMFSGQMLIPFFLSRAWDRAPSSVGLLMAPSGIGMMCLFPFIGKIVKTFGVRNVSTSGAIISLLGTASLGALVSQPPNYVLLAIALFMRGVGSSLVGIPTVSAAYSSVKREDLPMATTALNIIMRIGGPTLTTACATFLGWRLSLATNHVEQLAGFTAAFGLLCALQVFLLVSASRFPRNPDETSSK